MRRLVWLVKETPIIPIFAVVVLIVVSLFIPRNTNVKASPGFLSISVGTALAEDKVLPTVDYVITGSTVSTSVANGDVKVTPHTLVDSGWVTVEYYSKLLTGNVEMPICPSKMF